MMKRIKLPGWIVIILLLVGVTFGMNQLLSQAFEGDSEINGPEKEVEDSSIYPGLNIETKTEEADLYTSSISLPYTDHEQVNKPINEWVEAQKKEFTSEVQKSKRTLEENGFRAHLNIQVETEEIAEKLYTLEFESYQITGGANGMTKTKSFVIDLNKDRHVQLEDVFRLNEETIGNTQHLIRESLSNNDEVSPYLFEDMVQDALKNLDKWKWSISRDHVIFYFDEYEIAAGAAGSVKAEIPMEEIKPYLQDDFADRLDVTIPEKEKRKEETEHSEEKAELDPDGKYVALTFDDGPHPDVTPRILDTLDKHGAKATFFMLGSQVEYYPSLANRVEEEGHEIGNHTMNHQDLTVLGREEVREEMQGSRSIIEDAIGHAPSLLRPPYGASNGDVEQVTSELGQSMVMWSVDSLDWKSRDAQAVNEKVMSNVTEGSIVLLHDIHSSTADALPQLLDSLEEHGYQMVTVSQLLELQGEQGVGPHYGN